MAVNIEEVLVNKNHSNITSVGKWVEGNSIQINDRERKVNYDADAGDLYVTFRGARYFYSEFERKELV